MGFASPSNTLPEGPLQKLIVRLDSDKYVFHWTPKWKIRSFLGIDENSPLTQETLFKFTKKESSDQLDSDTYKGMYFALNPVTSSRYSGETSFSSSSNTWMLVVLKIPRNTLFLNYMNWLPNSQYSNEETLWFKKQGCNSSADPTDRACRLNAYSEAAGVSGYFYSWSSASFSFCEPDSALAPTALVLRNANLIQPKTISFFDLSSADETQNNAFLSVLNSLFGFYTGQMDYVANFSPWNKEKLNSVDPKILRDFAQHSLMGACK